MTLLRAIPKRKRDSEALSLLATLLAPYLLDFIGVSARPATAEIDLAESPAGKRRAYAAARAGEIEGAKKLNRRWSATRAAHDEWLDGITVRAPKTDTTTTAEAIAPTSLDGMRARLGLKRVG